MARQTLDTIVISDSDDDAGALTSQDANAPANLQAEKSDARTESDRLDSIASKHNYTETVLYSFKNDTACCNFPLTSKSILSDAISSQHLTPVDHKDSFDDFNTKLKESTNYDIIEIVQVNNKPRRIVFDAMCKAYAVDNKMTVYHGTSLEIADIIKRVGFKGSASKRSVWGSGCYVGKRFLEAAGYAMPEKDKKTQIILVCKLLVGPHKVGSMNQQDFGEDSSGKPIMTLTNYNQTILCASQEAQIIVNWYIKIRWCSSIAWKDSFSWNNSWLHPDILRKYQFRSVLGSAGAYHYGKSHVVAPTPAAAQPKKVAQPVVAPNPPVVAQKNVKRR